MNKTPLMLRAEEKIGEQIEIFLPKMYEAEWQSSNYLGKMFGVHSTTVRRWLVKLGIKLRKGPNDYLEMRIKRPHRGTLKYYYEFARKPVSEIAKERGVWKKTVYRWLEEESIERRGTNSLLKKGFTKPSDKKLIRLLEEHTNNEIAKMYNVDPYTVRVWKKKAGIYKFRKSKYDNPTLRIKQLADLFNLVSKKSIS